MHDDLLREFTVEGFGTTQKIITLAYLYTWVVVWCSQRCNMRPSGQRPLGEADSHHKCLMQLAVQGVVRLLKWVSASVSATRTLNSGDDQQDLWLYRDCYHLQPSIQTSTGYKSWLKISQGWMWYKLNQHIYKPDSSGKNWGKSNHAWKFAIMLSLYRLQMLSFRIWGTLVFQDKP